ncbi:MAG: ATP-binding protein [Oscillospiraceae bacterium]|nr:ATP-binding protein [Oscillospiraceae bacterium]
MFTKIIIKNVLGINNEIVLDFIAKPKQKIGKDTIVEIDKFTNVGKTIGIIGSNASGKTSIIKSMHAIGLFLIQNEIIDGASKGNDEINNQFIRDFKANTLPGRNLDNKSQESKIEIEMFIVEGKRPGVYTYSLTYDDQTLNEKLTYRNKYNSKKVIEVENYNSENRISDIGYKCFYKDSIVKDYEKVGKRLVEKFNDTMKYYETFYKYYISNVMWHGAVDDEEIFGVFALNSMMENNDEKKLLQSLLKLIDWKIESIVVDKNHNNGDDVVKFVTDKGARLEYWQLSTGTRKMIRVLYISINRIKNNGIMIIDEIETALHRELVQLIIDLYKFSDGQVQLIFTTHIPEILDKGEMRNDQKFYLDQEDGDISIVKISDRSTRADFSISKNYYETKKLSPQPDKEQIEKFCELFKKQVHSAGKVRENAKKQQ